MLPRIIHLPCTFKHVDESSMHGKKRQQQRGRVDFGRSRALIHRIQFRKDKFVKIHSTSEMRKRTPLYAMQRCQARLTFLNFLSICR